MALLNNNSTSSGSPSVLSSSQIFNKQGTLARPKIIIANLGNEGPLLGTAPVTFHQITITKKTLRFFKKMKSSHVKGNSSRFTVQS